MNTHLSEAARNDWVDGCLAPADRAVAEQHLAACVACRTEVERLTGLLAELHALPRELAPAHDLRPGIALRIAAESGERVRAGEQRVGAGPRHEDGATASAGSRGGWRERTLASVRPQLAAAALLLIALSSATTLWLVERGANPRADAGAMVPDIAAAEARYRQAAAELEAVLRDIRHELSPATVQLFERSLATVDRALDETRAALVTDPGNPTLTGIMMASYEKKIELLRRATELGDG